MESWGNWIYDNLGVNHSLQYKLVATLIAAIILYALYRVTVHLLFKSLKDVKTRYNWSKNLSYFGYILFIVIISPVWITEFQSIGTFLGLLSAGLAIALKDPVSNFFAWVYIIVKKPFEMGDRIQINNIEGDILNIGFFEFTLLEIKNWVKADQSTGRIIHVPNGLLFTQPVMNYNQAMDFIWNETPILITFESNWQKAKEILVEIEESILKPKMDDIQPEFRKAHKKFFVTYNYLSPTVYTKIQESGVLLTLRYLCPPKKRRDFEQAVNEEILTQFAKHADIHFAYPTTRFYKAEEGTT
jgi:small-conductance mechanosensitive channel